MSTNELMSLLPLMITAGGAVLLLMLIGIKRSHQVTHLAAMATLLAAFLSLVFMPHKQPVYVQHLLVMDSFGALYMGMIFLASFFIILISRRYLENVTSDVEEYYILILLATLGSTVLAVSHHFITFFLGIEILSSSLYVLIAFFRYREHSLEAGIKYLILAAVSSAFLLFGMALVYASLGTMYFPDLASFLKNGSVPAIAAGGFGLIIVGVGFKLALVPFHLWTADVYEGAPAPVSALVATVSKGGVFALWLRFILDLDAFQFPALMMVLGIMAAVSMLTGNLLALLQNNVKRILAYSSIAHMGYLLVAFLTGSHLAVESSTFYLIAYMITSLGAFGVVTVISGSDRDATSIDDYKGLFTRRPWLASFFAIMLLSLAGIPLTAGFMGKFYILMAGVEANLWWLVIILVISSTIGLFYYLKIILAMFSQPEENVQPKPVFNLTNTFFFVVLSVGLIGLGIYPTLLIKIIHSFSMVM
ncbi:MAG TPA: NADH-quinone oxidoreductase subunit N [Sunxiuqinia sp.]|nr:NADH-quinone oxidoreductase subunit N [Sunxiuqinia sp.]